MRDFSMRHATLAAFTALGLFAASPSMAQTPAPAPATGGKMAPPSATAPKADPAKSAATKPADLIDINHATAEQLSTLPGIAKARSEAIIKGRPYKGKDDLVQKKIIPENVYNDIKDKIIARQKG